MLTRFAEKRRHAVDRDAGGAVAAGPSASTVPLRARDGVEPVRDDGLTWSAFAAQVPDLATLALARMVERHLAFMATNRRSGWPRMSPIEPYVVDGELMLGVMWQSQKARDLAADDRITLHSPVTDWGGTEGEVKLYGRAVPVQDKAQRLALFTAIDAAHHNEPSKEDDPEYHMYTIRITEAGYVRFSGGDPYEVWHWRVGQELTKQTLLQ
jgi:hypothetical protein